MSGKFLVSPLADMCAIEKGMRRQGYRWIAGIDEAGRGPLAGPVVAAAVLFPEEVSLPRVKDSKLLSASQREACLQEILDCACDVGIGAVDAAEIDRINILQATFRAMLMAVEALKTPPDILLIDGPYKLPTHIAQQGIIGGDRQSLSIAAASIVAKVHRDRLMQEYHKVYPMYGFDANKGYGTREHMDALRRHGPCPLHRSTFRGVQ